MKRHCDDQALTFLVHHELSWGRELLVRLHLARCPGCRTRHQQIVGATAMLGAAARAEPIDGLPAFLFVRGRTKVRHRWMAVFGVALVIGTATFYLLSQEETPVAASTQQPLVGSKGDCK